MSVSNSNMVTITTSPGAEVRSSGAIALASNTSAGATPATAAATPATKNLAKASDVSQNLKASVDAYVGSQPVKSSGLFGSNNNSADISKATAGAQAQADKVGSLIASNNLSTTESLTVLKQFDSDLKAAAGKPLSTGQMLDLQIMIDKLATSGSTASTTTPIKPAAVAPTNKPQDSFGKTRISISWTDRGAEIDVSSNDQKVEIDIPASKSNKFGAPTIQLALASPTNKMDKSTADNQSWIRDAKTYSA